MVDSYADNYHKQALSEIRQFTHQRITQSLNNIYKYYLIQEVTDEGNKLLKALDLKLKEKCALLYQEFDGLSFTEKIVFHYVRIWRNTHYNKNNIVLSLYRTAYNIRKRPHKLNEI